MPRYLVETEINLFTGAVKLSYKGPVHDSHLNRWFERGNECEVLQDTFPSEKEAKDHIKEATSGAKN